MKWARRAKWWILCSCLSVGAWGDSGCVRISVGGSLWDETPAAVEAGSVIEAGQRLLRVIASQLPVAIDRPPPVPFSRQLSQLNDGELDAALWIYPVPQRKQAYHLTDPYFKEPLFIYTQNRALAQVTSSPELAGYVGVVLRNNSYGEELDQFFARQAEKIYQVERQLQAVAMVASGRADYFVASPMTSGITGVHNKILRGIQPLARQDVVMAFSKSSPCAEWIPAINRLIAGMLTESAP